MDAYTLFPLDSNRKINRKAGCSVKQIVQKEANQKAPLRKGRDALRKCASGTFLAKAWSRLCLRGARRVARSA